MAHKDSPKLVILSDELSWMNQEELSLSDKGVLYNNKIPDITVIYYYI